MSIKQPTESNTEFPSITEQKFTPLDTIIREETTEPITEPAVVDSEKETETSKEPVTKEALPTAESEKYAPLGAAAKVQDEITDDVVEDVVLEDDVEESPTTDSSTKSGVVSPEDTFNFFKEAGLLHIPENFEFDGKEETLQQVLEYDQKAREYYAAKRLEESIKDPKVFDLINHGMQGGAFADVAKMFEITSEQVNLESLDISNEADAEKVVRKYYKDVAKFSDDKAERFIRSAKSEETLESDAKDALAYFTSNYEKEKVRLNQEAVERKQAADAEFKQKISGIASAVKEANYQGEVLQGVASLVSPVVDSDNKQVFKEDGQPMLWYEVVVDNIGQNPKHLTQLLAMLQAYDSEKGFAKVAEQKQITKQSDKAKSTFDLFNTIGKKGKGGASDPTLGQQPWVPTPPNSYDE